MIKQKTTILILLLLTLFSMSYAQDLYDIENITIIRLTFEDSNWDYQMDQLYSAGNEGRLLGSAEVNGIQFDSVGVRYKGNSSYSSRNKKNPLNIKLDYMISDQEYDNYGTLKLSNVYNDPSFVREVLGYEIARNYMPASQSNYAKVYINGTYYGLYVSSQSVDKYFAKTHFAEKDNSFFKGELTNDNPNSTVEVWGYFGSLVSSYYSYYELESDGGWNDLVNFLDVFNNDVENVEDVLNVDRHLWMLAYDNLLVNLDAPINFGHNYYIYMDNAGRFNPIIWDLNENFGVFSNLVGSSSLSTTGKQQLTPYLNENNSNYPIISQMLADESYRKMYVAHMKTIMSEQFETGNYRSRALELQEIIDQEVQDDPNKIYTYANFISNIDYSIGSSGGNPGQPSSSTIGITQLMEARITYLNDLGTFSAQAPEISNLVDVEEVQLGEDILFKCEADYANEVTLCYRNSENDAFTKIAMYDDGAHDDGASSDGSYGVSLSASGSKLQYYFYAENDDAATFYPAGAEYTVCELSISGGLCINEFLADNESINVDANGDNDDWIELYNGSDSDISLSGYYLSDDSDDLTQWAFPDTSIPSGGYLIVWADKDEDVGELHAEFKLSASGEAIYLVNSASEIVDEVIFGAQTADYSMGRYENGSGDFVQMIPSFSQENTGEVTAVEHNGELDLINEYVLEPNYPNPFNPQTHISFSLPESAQVSLQIFDTAGKLVETLLENSYCASGQYNYTWNAGTRSTGIYFAVLTSGSQRITQKMILLK